MSWARHPTWPSLARRPHGHAGSAWSTSTRLGGIGNSLHRPNAAPLLHVAGSVLPGHRSAWTAATNKSAPVKGKPYWLEGWLKNKAAFRELRDRQNIPGSPPPPPIRGRGRPKSSTSKEPKPKSTSAWNTPGATLGASREHFEYTGPPLSAEQAHVVDLAAQGRNIFYTGSAGSGKSMVLRAVVQKLRALGKTVEVMAPTGKAALAINGSTTWTFAGWSPNSFKLTLTELKEKATKKGSKARRRFRQTDVIIIDEISMVENHHFERLNQILKVARVTKRFAADQHPFGGVQVIVTGDFAQLPPVKPFQHCMTCGSEMRLDLDEGTHNCRRCKAEHPPRDQWAFRSKAWDECKFAHVHLKTIHRQSGDDNFISMLQKCRLGDPFTPEEVDLLMNHEAETTGAVELYSTREEVRSVNEREYRKLVTTPHSFKAVDEFVWNEDKHPQLARKAERNADGALKCLDEHKLDPQLNLKQGMRVVLLANLDIDNGLCNGSQGTIVRWTAPRPVADEGFEDFEAAKTFGAGGSSHAELKRAQVVAFEKQAGGAGACVWPVVRFTNGLERAIRAECVVNELGDDAPYSLLCRTQIPLAPAWALSIHKAQGMTLDRVKVDLSRAFSEGQVYVALSRATSLKGLKVVGDPKGLMVGRGGNKEVRAFYKDKFGM